MTNVWPLTGVGDSADWSLTGTAFFNSFASPPSISISGDGFSSGPSNSDAASLTGSALAAFDAAVPDAASCTVTLTPDSFASTSANNDAKPEIRIRGGDWTPIPISWDGGVWTTPATAVVIAGADSGFEVRGGNYSTGFFDAMVFTDVSVDVAGGSNSVTASDLTTSPALDSPRLHQTHILSGTNLAATKAVMGSPALVVQYALTASSLTATAPAIGSPAIGQTHPLTATTLTATSAVMGAPGLIQGSALIASNMAVGAAAMGSPAPAQTHILASTNLTAVSAAMGTPALVQGSALSASNLTASNAVMGTPALVHIHALTGTNLTATSAAMGSPALSQTHTLTASALVVTSAVMGSPALSQAYGLTATNLVASSAVMGTPILWSGAVLTVNNMAVLSAGMGTPALGQKHILAVSEMVVLPVMGRPIFALRPIGRSEGRGHYQSRGIRYNPGRYASTPSRVARPVPTR